ncbi:MAG: ribonuclease PH [Deltaproteobacteria bacterium]|nr:ribonuclease PH [Deltaproteobacteria bacterium]
MRPDGRNPTDLRPIQLDVGYLKRAPGSCLVSFGDTRVLTSVTVEERVPPFRLGRGGWLSAEYGMLPGSTQDRKKRDQGKQDGRAVEIQRLIGRALRAAVRIESLPQLTLWVDCDVIEADGGTRCAAITGAYVSLAVALKRLQKKGTLKDAGAVLATSVSAISIGLVGGYLCVDLDYAEDSTAEADLNVVATGDGRLVEVAGAAEKGSFDRKQLDQMIDAGLAANVKLRALQEGAIRAAVDKL